MCRFCVQEGATPPRANSLPNDFAKSSKGATRHNFDNASACSATSLVGLWRVRSGGFDALEHHSRDAGPAVQRLTRQLRFLKPTRKGVRDWNLRLFTRYIVILIPCACVHGAAQLAIRYSLSQKQFKSVAPVIKLC